MRTDSSSKQNHQRSSSLPPASRDRVVQFASSGERLSTRPMLNRTTSTIQNLLVSAQIDIANARAHHLAAQRKPQYLPPMTVKRAKDAIAPQGEVSAASYSAPVSPREVPVALARGQSNESINQEVANSDVTDDSSILMKASHTAPSPAISEHKEHYKLVRANACRSLPVSPVQSPRQEYSPTRALSAFGTFGAEELPREKAFRQQGKIQKLMVYRSYYKIVIPFFSEHVFPKNEVNSEWNKIIRKFYYVKKIFFQYLTDPKEESNEPIKPHLMTELNDLFDNLKAISPEMANDLRLALNPELAGKTKGNAGPSI